MADSGAKPCILFLAVRMQQGYGVSVVVEELSRRLGALGVRVVVGCEMHDAHFPGVEIHRLAADAAAIHALAEQVGATHVIAHTSPWFEMLPAQRGVSTWAWEHGDPDPAFFPEDRAAREQQQARKRSAVYPHIDGVIAISHFIRDQLRWPAARVIYNGWEHVHKATGEAAANPWPRPEVGNDDAPHRLRVGCLMRLGAGEALYKGGEQILQLAQQARLMGLDADFALMGRGTASDARRYEKAGFTVFTNASDAQRAGFLQQLDVFVSPSLWEGCNLPLMEAQAMGVPALAFDTGAHPEVCAHVCGSIDEMLRLMHCWQRAPDLRQQAAERARRLMQRRFGWDRTTSALLRAVL